jgi:DNA repair protein SbcD/Mre11
MKILHTSDWHLGRSLHDKKRYDEFEAFLNWLIKFIAENKIDLLLIAGDVFDSSTPSNRAQELYYHFLGQIRDTGCRHVVVTGGNHDSPTFLDAPKNLLGALNIKVIGAITDEISDEIITVKDMNGQAEAIVCAVPFLRDRDIRIVEAGENPEDKTIKLTRGISAHYNEIVAAAGKLQDKKKKVPVIGMGHLFTRDAKTSEGDGVRELYIGSVAHIDGEDISEGFDYMALGHLHMSQTAGKSEKVRYSGSPLPMGFAEAEHKKKVIVVEFKDLNPVISEHDVPCFQQLIRITGDEETIMKRITDLKAKGTKAWLEIEVTSKIDANLITLHLNEQLAGSDLEKLIIKNKGIADGALSAVNENETLETLENSDVFKRCLAAYEIPEEEHAVLIQTYDEAIATMNNADPNAN